MVRARRMRCPTQTDRSRGVGRADMERCDVRKKTWNVHGPAQSHTDTFFFTSGPLEGPLRNFFLLTESAKKASFTQETPRWTTPWRTICWKWCPRRRSSAARTGFVGRWHVPSACRLGALNGLGVDWVALGCPFSLGSKGIDLND